MAIEDAVYRTGTATVAANGTAVTGQGTAWKTAGLRAGDQFWAKERSVTILRNRNQIDEEVSSSDAAALCGSYGLSRDDEAECVRRLREADAEPGNGRVYLPD